MGSIKWIKALTDNDATPVNHQFFDMREPIVFMVNPGDAEDKKPVRRNSYIHRLMIEAGWTEADHD